MAKIDEVKETLNTLRTLLSLSFVGIIIARKLHQKTQEIGEL